MAAVAYPSFQPRPQPVRRPHLRLVEPPAKLRRPSRVGMYWRRRLVAVLLLILVVLAARAALGVIGGGPLAAPETPAARGGGAAAGAGYVVQVGDTWWSIARHLQPSGDVRGLVDQLASRYGSTLQPGEHVALR